MQDDENNAENYIMMELATWIYGTIFQCERLLSLQVGVFANNRRNSVIEEEFVVVSGRKLIRWFNEACTRNFISQESFPEISRLAPIIVDVRDMREHADDYVVRKKGKKQSEFIHHAASPEGITFSSDATATIVLSGKYMIGGRLSVQSLLEAAKAARNEFNAIVVGSERLGWLIIR